MSNREYTDEDAYLNCINYIKKYYLKHADDEIYDEKKHIDWSVAEYLKESNEPIRFGIIQHTLTNNTYVYAVTDKEGCAPCPPKHQLKSQKIIIISQTKNGQNSHFKTPYKEKITLVFAIVFFIFIVFLSFFGKPLALYLRELNDPIRKASFAAVEEFKSARSLLKQEWLQKENSFSSYYLYTNDTGAFESYIEPDIDFYNNSYAPDFVNTQGQTDDILSFLEKKDGLGFRVILKPSSMSKSLILMNTLQSETRAFVVFGVYFYNEEDLAYLKNKVEGSKERFSLITKEEKIEKLSSLQIDKVFFSEQELNNKELETGLDAVMAPRVDLKNTSYKFYFATNKEDISKSEFEQQVELFKRMFLKDQDIFQCCQIKEISINKSDLSGW